MRNVLRSFTHQKGDTVKEYIYCKEFWLGLTAIAAAIFGYLGNGDRSMYTLAATCVSLIIAIRWVDSMPGPAPTPKPQRGEVIGGQMRYLTTKSK